MTCSVAEVALNRAFDFAKTRPEKKQELTQRIRDSAGTRRAMVSVPRLTGPPIEVEVWLTHEDNRIVVIWLNRGGFPDNEISKEEMATIRATLDAYFERYDKHKH